MAFEQDIQVIRDVVQRGDIAMRHVKQSRIDVALDELERAAKTGQTDQFLLGAMRLFALAGNGHTRVIPNAAIQVHPMRFVSLGSRFYLTDGADDFESYFDLPLVSVNGVSVAELMAAWSPFLAGTCARKHVIAGILCAWPSALDLAGAPSLNGTTTYCFEGEMGQDIRLNLPTSHIERADAYYPPNDPGTLIGVNASKEVFTTLHALRPNTWHIKLPNFVVDDAVLGPQLTHVIEAILQHPTRALILDLRGNPGGSFLKAMPLIETLKEQWRGTSCIVLIDKFTFSAGIVFVAILKAKMSDRVQIIGENMGDRSAFYAEGGTIVLEQSKASLRYSDAFHDWENGHVHPSTPAEIAQHLVAAGSLRPEYEITTTALDLRNQKDPVLDHALTRCCP